MLYIFEQGRMKTKYISLYKTDVDRSVTMQSLIGLLTLFQQNFHIEYWTAKIFCQKQKKILEIYVCANKGTPRHQPRELRLMIMIILKPLTLNWKPISKMMMFLVPTSRALHN